MSDTTENLEMLKDLGTTGFENVRALGELNMRTWEKLIEQQMDGFGLWVNTGIEQVKLITETSDYADLLQSQTELSKQFGENLNEKGRQVMSFSSEVGDEYRVWFENGVNKLTGKADEEIDEAA